MNSLKPISSRMYAIALPALVAIKFAVEWTFTKVLFGYNLSIWAIVVPLSSTKDLPNEGLSRDLFISVYLVWSVSFIAAGYWLTLRRVRTLNVPARTSLFFFLPVVNVLQYLSLVRHKTEEPIDEEAWYKRIIITLESLVVTMVLGVAYTAISVYVLNSYGSTLFFGSPFIFGIVNGYMLNRKDDIGIGKTQTASALGMVMLGGALILCAMEGVVCIAMAAPLALAMSAIGAPIGRLIAQKMNPRNARLQVFAALALLPLVGSVEAYDSGLPPARSVVSAIEINATPEQVWKYIVDVPEMPAPDELAFRIGIAYPMRASAAEHKVGASRTCVFNTGDALETITALEPNELLRFHIYSQPNEMEETSPYEHVDAPHLHGFVVSEDGEFKLTRLANGHTLLQGKSWYRSHIAPGKYWALFTDQFIHLIHHRVFKQIKRLAEADASSTNL